VAGLLYYALEVNISKLTSEKEHFHESQKEITVASFWRGIYMGRPIIPIGKEMVYIYRNSIGGVTFCTIAIRPFLQPYSIAPGDPSPCGPPECT